MTEPLENVRTLYLSSEYIPEFQSSRVVSIPLVEYIHPSEGYDLVYSLKSLGFKSTAMNISDNLKNNRLRFEIYYDTTNVSYYYDINETIPANRIKQIDPTTPTDFLPPDSSFIEIVIPDGHYTVNELFEILSTNSVVSNSTEISTTSQMIIPSGYYRDYEGDRKSYHNIISMRVLWEETNFGYTINLVSDTSSHMKIPSGFLYSELYPNIIGFAILPSELDGYDALFNKLFTYLQTEIKNTPISNPQRRGKNPHDGIDFLFNTDMIAMDALIPQDPTEADNVIIAGLQWDKNSLYILERGNEKVYDTEKGIFPNGLPYDPKKYTAFAKPILDPLFIEITINLPNASMDEQGNSNMLTRLFTMGTSQGNVDLYQTWDNPKRTTLPNGQGFSTINLSFDSQGGLWDFFNLLFLLEFELGEVQSQQLLNEIETPKDVVVPPSDEITDANASIGLPIKAPLSARYFPYQTTSVHLNKKTRFL